MYEGVRKYNNINNNIRGGPVQRAQRGRYIIKYIITIIIILYRRARRWVKLSAVPTGMEATRALY